MDPTAGFSDQLDTIPHLTPTSHSAAKPNREAAELSDQSLAMRLGASGMLCLTHLRHGVVRF